nr:Tmem57 protein [Hymenolepis microstoma]
MLCESSRALGVTRAALCRYCVKDELRRTPKRRQSQVETHNSKYFCLLDLALPEEARALNRRGELGNGQLAVMGPLTNANHTAPATNSASPNNHNNTGTNFLAVTSSNANSNVTAASSTKNSKKQQQQQNMANGKVSGAIAAFSSTSNCDHSPASSINQATTDRKVFPLEGSDQHQNQQLAGYSGEGISSSCSSLSGQDAPPATATVAETRAGAKRTPPAPLTQITPSASNNNRSKGNDKSSRAGKDSSVYRMEDELRRLRHERQSMLVTESELRAQLAQLTTLERTSRTETNQARQEVEFLQSKLSTLTQRLETERDNLQAAEKRAAEEKRQRSSLEVSLASEKRARREAENALKAAATASPFGAIAASNSFVNSSSASTNASNTNNNASTLNSKVLGKSGTGVGPVGSGSSSNNPRSLCSPSGNPNASGLGLSSSNRCTSDTCTHRIHDLESRVKSLTRELKDVQLLNATQANLLKQHQSQQQHQNSEQLTDLMLHLSDIEAENACLKAKLKNEDKVKQELLAGYHNSLKEITELNATLTKKEYQIVDLYMRLDSINPNSPFHCLINNGVPQDNSVSSPGPDGRAGNQHLRIPCSSSNSFMNPTTSGGSLFSSLDFDFGVGSSWPPPQFPGASSSTNTSVAFSDQHLLNFNQPQLPQPPRLRSESTNTVFSAFMNRGGPHQEKNTISSTQSRFDVNSAEVDLEAASSSLSPTEFLSKLRIQLAAAAGSGQLPQSSQPASQPAPISPPSRDISGGISSLPVGGGIGEERSEESNPLDHQQPMGDGDTGGSGGVEGIHGVDGVED